MTHTPQSAGGPSNRGDAVSGLEAASPDRRLPGRNVTKADILVYRRGGVDLALKDYSARPWIIRNTLGRMLVRREVRAYRAAGGVRGIPQFLGRRGGFALATRWVEARPLADHSRSAVDDGVFDRVQRIVEELHERGIALGDLHHRDVLLGKDGSVFLVDLATAWVLGDRPGRLRHAIFERLRDADRVAVARMRARWTGGDVARAPDLAGPRAAAWHRNGRWLKRLWNRLRKGGQASNWRS